MGRRDGLRKVLKSKVKLGNTLKYNFYENYFIMFFQDAQISKLLKTKYLFVMLRFKLILRNKSQIKYPFASDHFYVNNYLSPDSPFLYLV